MTKEKGIIDQHNQPEYNMPDDSKLRFARDKVDRFHVNFIILDKFSTYQINHSVQLDIIDKMQKSGEQMLQNRHKMPNYSIMCRI